MSERQAAEAVNRAFERMPVPEETRTRFNSTLLWGKINAPEHLGNAPQALLTVVRAAALMYRLTQDVFGSMVLPPLKMLEHSSAVFDSPEYANTAELGA